MALENDFGNEEQHRLLWEPHSSASADAPGHSAIHTWSNDKESAQTNSIAKVQPNFVGGPRRVSLLLEDMQPETANRVTSMLLNSNVDVKMKMTVR